MVAQWSAAGFLDNCACTHDGYKVIDTTRGCTIIEKFETNMYLVLI